LAWIVALWSDPKGYPKLLGEKPRLASSSRPSQISASSCAALSPTRFVRVCPLPPI
jgi:hypothetical protein